VRCGCLCCRSLLTDVTHVLTARARGDTTLLELTKDTFLFYPKAAHFARMSHMFEAAKPVAVLPILHRVPFFARISRQHLALLAALMQVSSCDKGQVICREGEVGDKFYLVVDGSVQIVAEGA
jgi:CRP-like cAMP-binding protein